MNKMPSHKVEFRFLSEPTDINYGGKVHGGVVMKWIDQAAYACASQWCEGYCVTVYVGGIRFFAPIHIGHVVQATAKLLYTGNTSMHISVDVASKSIHSKAYVKNTHCIIVFVAVDEEGKPQEVPKWTPRTENGKKMEEYAKRLMTLRKGIEEEMKAFF